MGAAFALAGIVVGVLITSGYNFWSVRRKELLAGSVAARALDDEVHWLLGGLSKAVASSRPVHLDATAAVTVWREQREALVLWVRAETSRELGDALRACERWQEDLSEFDSALTRSEIEAAKAALAQLADAQLVLRSLAAYLWSEHEIFILTTLFRMIGRLIVRTFGGDPTWRPPSTATGAS